MIVYSGGGTLVDISVYKRRVENVACVRLCGEFIPNGQLILK